MNERVDALEGANELPTAFLSHSSLDKPFVEAVAKRLGRAQVFLDRWGFETGDKFAEAIPEALNASDVFILFASRASLKAFWVNFETKNAKKLIASSVIRKAIVFIIDAAVQHTDLPKWMQSSLIRKVTSANAVAREVQNQLNLLRGAKLEEYFYGRDSLLQEFTRKLIPEPEAVPPHIMIIAGLSGVGRKSFARNILERRLSMRMGPIFHLRKTDGLDALHFAVLAEAEPLLEKADFASQIAKFRASSLPEKSDEIGRLLALVTDGNVAPFIVDDGAFLQSDGQLTPDAVAVFEHIHSQPELVLVLILSRIPQMSGRDLTALGMCSAKVGPLDSEEARQLLSRRLSDYKIKVSADQISALVPHLNGYPPAINLAATYAKDYGIATLLADTSTLTNFQQQTFSDVLVDLNLSEVEWGILRVLAAGLELPVEGLLAATKQSAAVIVPAVRRLVDLSLVLNGGTDLTIAYPIIYAVQATKGIIPADEFAIIGRNLKAEFWDKSETLPDYGIIGSTINALMRNDDPDLKDFKDFIVPSMLYRSAKDRYQMSGHENWTKANELLKKLLELEPSHHGGLVLLIKIQVRLQAWKEASEALQKVKLKKFPEQHFLEGFILWKQRKYEAAIPHFRTALALGQKALEIYHALAICLFRLNDLDGAKKIINQGLHGRARHNILLIDLAAQIAITRGDLNEAENYIDQLRRLSAMSDYHHRLATLLKAKKQSNEALIHAKLALKTPRLRFEVETVLIDTLIEVRDFTSAEQELDVVDRKYSFERNRKDIRIGLRCKLLLRQGQWREAEPLWDALEEKGSPVHAALRKELLEQKIADVHILPTERKQANAELIDLGGIDHVDLAMILLSELGNEGEDEYEDPT